MLLCMIYMHCSIYMKNIEVRFGKYVHCNTCAYMFTPIAVIMINRKKSVFSDDR